MTQLYIKLHATQVHLPSSKIAVIILFILIFTCDDLRMKKKINYASISFGNCCFMVLLWVCFFFLKSQMVTMDGTRLNPTAVKSIRLVGRISSSDSGHLLMCLNAFPVGNEILKGEINMHCRS